MTRMILLCAWSIFLCGGPDAGQDSRQLEKKAADLYSEKKFAQSADQYVAAIKAGSKGPNIAYNAACSFALAGNKERAFEHLHLAIERGYRDLPHLKSDADLKSLHPDKQWTACVEQIEAAQKKIRAAVIAPDLRDELLQRKEKDQEARKAAPFDADKCKKVDRENTARMKQIVEKFGWPGNTLVGTDGAFAAWLLVQHADADPKFQAECLVLMKLAYEGHEVRGQDLAYLTDRVMVNQEKKQLYGTQFWTPPQGKTQPRPIEDEANLEARRAQMGLGPFSEYKKLMTGE